MTGIPVAVNELVDTGFLNEIARGHYRKSSIKSVASTVSATDLLNAEITIGAGALGTTRMARLTAYGDWSQGSGSAAGLPRFQLLFGGTTVLDTGGGGVTISSGGPPTAWRIQAEIFNRGAANAQSVFMHVLLHATVNTGGSAAFSTGEGLYGNIATGSSQIEGLGFGGATIDTTAAKTLVLNVVNASASASYQTNLYGALVEII